MGIPEAAISAHLSSTYSCSSIEVGRFVNVHGGRGKNIPRDLYNEHQNKLFKEQTALPEQHVLTPLYNLTKMYTSIPPPTTKHSTKDDEHDVVTVCSNFLCTLRCTNVTA